MCTAGSCRLLPSGQRLRQGPLRCGARCCLGAHVPSAVLLCAGGLLQCGIRSMPEAWACQIAVHTPGCAQSRQSSDPAGHMVDHLYKVCTQNKLECLGFHRLNGLGHQRHMAIQRLCSPPNRLRWLQDFCPCQRYLKGRHRTSSQRPACIKSC